MTGLDVEAGVSVEPLHVPEDVFPQGLLVVLAFSKKINLFILCNLKAMLRIVISKIRNSDPEISKSRY